MGLSQDGYKQSVEMLENLLLGSSSRNPETKERTLTGQFEEARGLLSDLFEERIEGYSTCDKNNEAAPCSWKKASLLEQHQ